MEEKKKKIKQEEGVDIVEDLVLSSDEDALIIIECVSIYWGR